MPSVLLVRRAPLALRAEVIYCVGVVENTANRRVIPCKANGLEERPFGFVFIATTGAALERPWYSSGIASTDDFGSEKSK